MATYIAQNNLKQFEEVDILTSTPTTWTSTQATDYLKQWIELKRLAQEEINANVAESEQQVEENNTARLLSIENSLLALGYLCDNSSTDWYKLYNKPKTYGTNWQAQADYQISISTGVDYFLNHAYNILYGPYILNTWYDAGDTFYYEGQLYEVIQSHTTQVDWIPSETPALYKKAVLPDEIPDWVQPTGAHDAYNTGDKVRFEGHIYQSLIDGNVWSPTAYPAGWQLIE